MAKLTRGAYALYIDASMNAKSSDWFLIGKDIEDLSVDLGTDIETVKNILDETTVKDNGFEPTISADPYYANTTDTIYEPLLNIAMNREKGETCKSQYLEVIIEDASASTHKAWIEDCVIKPNSYGGDTSGLQIPFSIYPDGNRKAGTVTITAGKPTFTPNP